MKALQVSLLFSFALGSPIFNITNMFPDVEEYYVPGVDGYTWVSKSHVTQEIASILKRHSLVKYHLQLTSNSSGHLLDPDDKSTLINSNFNPRLSTIIIVHGFGNTYPSTICTLITKAFFKIGNFNIICVDWGGIAKASYPTARFAVPAVAENLAFFLEFMHQYANMSIKDLTLIGHSLGSHISGLAGKSLKRKGYHLELIVGCDVALPLFSFKNNMSRLSSNDAKFVVSIHTTGGRLGFLRPIGDQAFYPNGGRAQPGCGIDLFGGCSHSRSYMYLAEAIEFNDFPTYKCNGFIDALVNLCSESYSSVKMMLPLKSIEKGIFYVPVNGRPKFGKN